MNDVNFINFVPEKLNLPAITYEKLLNTELKNQKLLEKNLFQMAEALNFKRKKNKEKIFYKFEIKEIPSSEKNTSKIALEIIFDRESKSISIFSNENDDFILNGELEEGNSCLIKIKASEHISGTTLMLIWDKFCSLLYPGRVELMDAAKVFCKHCLPKTKSKFLLRMWRVLGDMHTPAIGTLKKMKVIKDIDEDSLAGGWYEKFGYLPEIPSKKYLQALRYLSTVTIGDLEKIYQKDERNLAIIKKCFEFAVDHNTIRKK